MLICILIGGLAMFFAGTAARDFQNKGDARDATTCVIEMAIGGYFLIAAIGAQAH